MAETSQTTKNIHRHNTSGIIFASIILLCIAIISLVITLTALGKDEAPPKDDSETNESGNKEENKNPEGGEEKPNDENKNPEGSEENPGQNTPAGNKTETLENSKVYRGPLILLSENSVYNRSIEELITRSSMGKLDANKVRSQYGFINLSSGHTGDFILKDRNLFLDIETAEALRKMMEAYVAETGHKNIWLRNAYYYDSSEDIKTTSDINEALLNSHAAGISVDLQISTANGQIPLKNAYSGYPGAEYYDWFILNCHKYGFIHEGNTDLYSTFRYVGVAHATYMFKNDISLAAYLTAVKGKTAQDRLVISDESGKEWWVYYIKATEGESTDITVFGSIYSISGNNTDGFIVTIDTSGL